MSILVSGGAGYVGSHACVELIEAGYDVIVADNLVNASREAVRRVEQITGKAIPFVQADLCDPAAVEEIFEQFPSIDAVMHFAALKAVGESVRKPLEYYANNLGSTLVLLEGMRTHGVKKFVFSSSATVYGDPASVPIREDALLSATNPYGYTKLFIEQILTDCCKADPELRVALLRYFDPIGAHPSGLIGEDPNGIPNNLIPYIAKVVAGQLKELHIFGNDWPTHDGTGVRDYIHIMDLARGHVAALKRLDKVPGCSCAIWEPAGGTACWTFCTLTKRYAVKSCLTLWIPAAPAMWPPAGPTLRRRGKNWAGRPGTALRRCARPHGTGSRKTPTDTGTELRECRGAAVGSTQEKRL